MHKKIVKDHLGNKDSLILVGPIHPDITAIEKKHLETKAPIVCIDGGAKNCPFPHLSIGDGDSLGRSCEISFSAEKDFTDLEGFIQNIPDNIKYIHAFGFSGGRFDHQLVVLGNFFNLADSNRIRIQMHGRDPLTILPLGDHDLEMSGTFSLLTLSEAKVSISGDCQYTLDSATLPPFSGNLLSNIGRGKIHLSSNVAVGVINVRGN